MYIWYIFLSSVDGHGFIYSDTPHNKSHSYEISASCWMIPGTIDPNED